METKASAMEKPETKDRTIMNRYWGVPVIRRVAIQWRTKFYQGFVVDGEAGSKSS